MGGLRVGRPWLCWSSPRVSSSTAHISAPLLFCMGSRLQKAESHPRPTAPRAPTPTWAPWWGPALKWRSLSTDPLQVTMCLQHNLQLCLYLYFSSLTQRKKGSCFYGSPSSDLMLMLFLLCLFFFSDFHFPSYGLKRKVSEVVYKPENMSWSQIVSQHMSPEY